MCFFDQHRFECGDWKWGHFRQHCAKEYRIGETCGMKLIMQTVPVAQKCKLCQKIDIKMQRREAEVERINRWQKDGSKFKASIDRAMEMIRSLDGDVYELGCERSRRLQEIGTQTDEVFNSSDVDSGDNPEAPMALRSDVEARLIRKKHILLGLPITMNCFKNPTTIMASPDTGAGVNCISMEMVQKLGLTILRNDGVVFRLMNGKTASCSGIVKSWCRFGKTYEFEPGGWMATFYVMHKLASPLIMSHKFLRESETFSRYRDRLVRLSISIPMIPKVRALGDAQERLMCSLDGQGVDAFPDSGSDVDLISHAYAQRRGFSIIPQQGLLMFADKTLKRTNGICILQLTLGHGATRLQPAAHEDLNLSRLADKPGRTDIHSQTPGATSTTSSLRAACGEMNISAGEKRSFRDVIESTFHVVDDIDVDVLIGSASLETLRVYSQNTKFLNKRPAHDMDGEETPLNRIIYLSAFEQKLRDISQSWLMRACKKKSTANQVSFEQALLIADQEENARREAMKQCIEKLDTGERLDAEGAEASRQSNYEEYKAMLVAASKPKQ